MPILRAQAPAVTLEVDHIIPVCEGGDDGQDNLATSCFDCNRGKSGTPLDAVPESLSEKAERKAEMHEQMQALAEVMANNRQTIEGWCWEIAEVLQPGASDGWCKDKFRSVNMFVDRIGYPEALDAAHVAVMAPNARGRVFKYFCAICWRKAKEVDQ